MSQKGKIGILTHFNVCNFGANLQAFSTASYLKNNGFTPIFISWEGYQKNLLKGIAPEQVAAHQNWINKNLTYTEACHNDEEIRNVIKKEGIQAVIVGSDAVLTYRPFLNRLGLSKTGIKIKKQNADYLFPNPHWLSFMDSDLNIPAALMSPSNQNTLYWLIRFSLRRNMGRHLKKFAYLSARDSWTRGMIRYLNPDAGDLPVTPDPVFAFNQNVKQDVTKEEILAKFGLPEKYVLVSFHNNKEWLPPADWMPNFKKLMNEKGIACVELTMPKGSVGFNLDHKIERPLDPLDWYNLIRFSSGYIGHLMHSIIVSLHNNVPFYSFDNYGFKIFKYFQNSSSSKIYDILKNAGLLANWQKADKISSTPPAVVSEALLNFDKEKCKAFSIRKTTEYNKMLGDIRQALNIG